MPQPWRPRVKFLVFFDPGRPARGCQFSRELLRPLREGRAVASYARQIARPGHRYANVLPVRLIDPAVGAVRTENDTEMLGVGADAQNVASAVCA